MVAVVNIYTRSSRPRLKTPHIGDVGDLCDRSFEGECDVDFILRKYGSAGGGAARFGVSGDFSKIPSDLVDLHNHMSDIASMMRDGESVDAFLLRLASSDKPVDKPADLPSDKPVVKPVVQPSDNPIDNFVEPKE